MNEEEIAFLKADNERLSKIIGIVVEQNELLKLENSFLKKAVTPKDIINSFAKIGTAIKDKENALANIGNGQNAVSNATVETNHGNNDSRNEAINNKDGNNGLNSGSAKLGEQIKQEAIVLPTTIPLTSDNIFALEKELKGSGYNRIRDSGVNNAAKLLIHFYNNGDGSYPALKKITGHSTDGIAKFIMSMKKRDWIHRYGFQRFGVSEKGVALIKQALTKSREN